MRKTRIRIAAITSFLMLIFLVVNGQQPNNIAKWISTQSRSSIANPDLYKQAAPTRSVPTLKDGHFLEINNNTLASLLVDNPTMIEISLPVNNHETITLLLGKVEVTAPDFIVSAKGNESKSLNYTQGIHYRGIIKGDNQSIASMSFFNNEVSGFYSSSKGDYTIGKVKNENDLYAVYNEKLEPHPSFNCFSETLDNHFDRPKQIDDRGVACKVVKVYFECDYKMYQDKGSSVSNVTDYVTAFFNQVATLYQNENIDIQISQITVWNTVDPYANLTSTSAVLNSFLSTLGPNFNGDVAHFLTTRNLGGGIAYVDVLCNKNYAFGVSAIYNTYSNVPTFSWTIECVTHELGHNLGSPHTQSCTWPGGAIDNCYATEGGCPPGPPPVNGGTIMSYCHLTNYGINFNNGFGPLPGNLIRTKVTNASCLAQNGVVPTGLTTTNITSSSATLNWGSVPNTTEYTIQYKLATSTAWITAGTSATTTFNLTGLVANTNYNWRVKTACSDNSAAASFTTLSGSTCNVPTNLVTSSITSSSAIVSWAGVSGATNYTVQYKLSSSGTWTVLAPVTGTSLSLTGLLASTTYNWQVKANCSSYSATQSFTTTSSGGCNAPTNLVSSSITATSAVLSWSAVSGASNYTVQYKLSSASIWITLSTVTGTTTTLTGLTASSNYNWQVKANCSVYSTIASFTTLQSGGCAIPTNLTTTNITSTSAQLNWASVGGATTYTVQYKLSTSTVWITLITLPQTSVLFNGLTPSTTYNWQVKANCSGYSNPVTFTTAGSGECTPPTGLTTSSITENSAILSWSAVSGATTYTLQYKLASSSTWITLITTSATAISFTGLSPSTTYNWQVKANCSAYSATASFTTNAPACTVPTGLQSSNITYNSASVSWSLVPNSTSYIVEYRLSTSSTWIPAGTTTNTFMTLSNLISNTAYAWHVKTNCSVFSPDASFTTLSGSCNPPANLTTGSITSSAAVLGWDYVSGATSYTIQYKLASSTIWTTLAPVYVNSFTLSGLLASTSYNWQIKANCSAYSAAVTFTTLALSGGCTAPTGLFVNNMYPTSVLCNWDQVPGATSYILIYKISTNVSWTVISNITSISQVLSGLQPATNYTWYVKANCATAFSAPATFTTPGGLPAIPDAINQYRLYPNPVKDQFHLQLDNEIEIPTGTVEIYSLDGRLKQQAKIDSNDMILSTSELASGIYLVRIAREGIAPQVLKFVKEE